MTATTATTVTPATIATRQARPRAVLFDAYGTLFDVYSVAVLAEQLFPGFGERLAALWRDKQIDYTRLTSMSGRYRPFWELTRAGLRFAALRLGLALDTGSEDRLMNQYRHLGTFAENREVLAELQARGVPAGILSNGDPEMLGAVVKSAGFSGLLEHVISVHPIRKFKTDPATYALGTQALGLPAHEVLFVSSNAWDAIGATWFGYTTLWVNRAGAPLEQLDTLPTRIGTSLRNVLDFFPPSSSPT
jgi:2-haloacid dehalogenase